MVPISLKLIENRTLQIAWDDDTTKQISIAKLRGACPCATCQEKQTAAKAPTSASKMQLPVLSAEQLRPLTIRGMRPAGNYAYKIDFSDGHSSGLFTMDLLYEIGESIGG